MIKEAFILDYDCGNFSSLRSWLNKSHIPAYLIQEEEEFEQLNQNSLLILPGVGHFKKAYSGIVNKNFKPALDLIRGKVPILGICLGAQIMFESSEESPECSGLGWCKGKIRKLPGSECPRLGWYKTHSRYATYENEDEINFFYYNHSYYINRDLANLNEFTSYSYSSNDIISDFSTTERVMGIQYHPEKSQTAGKYLLKYILENL